ncbi:MAG: flavin reductase [Bacteroidales bacterium]|nr:flavin reductase [Bacteroidales bacterium]
MSLNACGGRGTASKAAENQEQKLGEWAKVSPYELKNAVELFNKDWMAVAAGREGDMNAMTISWGSLGELWGKPVVTVYVSPTRYTYEFMERNAYFTVAAFPEEYREALAYIGSHSGRDSDKLSEAGLSVSFTELGNPFFNEANLVIECRILYSDQFDYDRLDDEIKAFYDRAGMKVHKAYIGEIINVWKR